ncbi:MAG: hypothetical protein IPL46_24885 [Saprospiraceae bacterium]|nr:hypothetical protein [Saprospiraceae bacterium]
MKATIILLTLFSVFNIAQAQIEEIGAITQQNGNTSGFKYRFTSIVDDTITIKIIDPRGELITSPVLNKAILSKQSVPFNFNSTFWRRGEYQIIVESNKGTRFVKRLNIDDSGKKIK